MRAREASARSKRSARAPLARSAARCCAEATAQPAARPTFRGTGLAQHVVAPAHQQLGALGEAGGHDVDGAVETRLERRRGGRL